MLKITPPFPPPSRGRVRVGGENPRNLRNLRMRNLRRKVLMKTSPIKIDKEGRWYFQGEEITHRKTYLLYCRSLTRDDGGRIVLRVGSEECPVEVEDAPFVVMTVEFVSPVPGREEEIWLTLNDETREKLVPETLRIGLENIPYCQVRNGMFEARFSRNAYQVLLPHILPDERENRFFLSLNGKKYPL